MRKRAIFVLIAILLITSAIAVWFETTGFITEDFDTVNPTLNWSADMTYDTIDRVNGVLKMAKPGANDPSEFVTHNFTAPSPNGEGIKVTNFTLTSLMNISSSDGNAFLTYYVFTNLNSTPRLWEGVPSAGGYLGLSMDNWRLQAFSYDNGTNQCTSSVTGVSTTAFTALKYITVFINRTQMNSTHYNYSVYLNQSSVVKNASCAENTGSMDGGYLSNLFFKAGPNTQQAAMEVESLNLSVQQTTNGSLNALIVSSTNITLLSPANLTVTYLRKFTNFTFNVSSGTNNSMAWCSLQRNTTLVANLTNLPTNISGLANSTRNFTISPFTMGNFTWRINCSDGVTDIGSERVIDVLSDAWWWDSTERYVMEDFASPRTLNWTTGAGWSLNYGNSPPRLEDTTAVGEAIHNFSSSVRGESVKLANFTMAGVFNLAANNNAFRAMFILTSDNITTINSTPPGIGKYLYLTTDNNRFRIVSTQNGVTVQSALETCDSSAGTTCSANCDCADYSYVINRTMVTPNVYNTTIRLNTTLVGILNLSILENVTDLNDGFQTLYFSNSPASGSYTFYLYQFNVTSQNFSSGTQPNLPPTIANVTVRPANASTTTSTLNCLVNVSDDLDTLIAADINWFNNTVNMSQFASTNYVVANEYELAGNISPTGLIFNHNWSCSARAHDNALLYSTLTLSRNVTLVQGNTAPTLNSMSVSPAAITANSTASIGCKINASDVDTQNLTLTISWFNSTSSGMVNVSTLASNYTLNTLNLNATNVTLGNITPTFHKNSGWMCGVLVSDGTVTIGPTNSSNITVTNLAPFVMTTPVIVPSNPGPSDRLNCTVQAGDLDNASVQVNFTWFRNGVYDSTFDSQTGCTNASTCYASALAFPVNKNQQWICSAVAYDGVSGSGPTNSSSSTIGNSLPNTPFLRAPANNTYANFSLLLRANSTDPDGDNLTFTFFVDQANAANFNYTTTGVILNATSMEGNFTYTNFTEDLKIFWRTLATDTSGNTSNFSVIQEFTINSLGKYNTRNITPITAFGANNLNCSANITDTNNATFLVNFTWFRNQVLNQSLVTTTCNNNTLCFHPVLLNESLVSKGDNWTCQILTDDAIMASNATNVTLNISDSPPRTSGTVTVPATYTNTTTILNCTTLYTDNDLDTGTITFSWLKNGTLMDFNGTILTVTNGSTIGTNYTIPAANTSKYDNWTCQASATSSNQVSNFTNATIQIPNSKPIFNVNQTVPVELLVNTFHRMTVNVTDPDADSILSCLFNATQPNGIRIVNTSTQHLNGSNGTNYDTDMWNSTLNFNATIGGVYNFSVDCGDGENRTVAFWRQALVKDPITISNFSFNSTFYYDTSYFTINVTTDQFNISNVRLNLTGPTKNVTLTPNLVSEGAGFFVYNTSYDWNQSGTWNFYIWANNSVGNQTQTSGSFSVTNAVSYSPVNLSKTVDPRNETVLVNVSIWHDSNQRFIFNLTLELENLSSKNYGQFNYSFEMINLTVGGLGNLTNPANRSEFRLQANNTIADGLYTGNITIFRLIDNTTTKIPILIGVNPPAGKIEASNTTGQLCDSSQTCKLTTTINPGSSTAQTFTFNNTGNFTLSNCSTSFTNDFVGISWISLTNTTPYNLQPNASITRTVQIVNPSNIGTFLGYVDVACQATVLGFTDRLSKNPINQPIINVVVVPATSGGGSATPGGGGGSQTTEKIVEIVQKNLTKEELLEKIGPICGNSVCDKNENPLACPADCKVNLDTLVCIKGEQCAWRQAYFGKVVFGGTVASILFLAFRPVLMG